MANVIGGSVCATARRKMLTAVIIPLLILGVTEQRGFAQTGDALPFAKGFLVPGNYVLSSVDLNPKAASGGFVSGTIPMGGVPADAQILAAYLYWEMISSNPAQVDGAQFRGQRITVVKASPMVLTPANAPCWNGSSG